MGINGLNALCSALFRKSFWSIFFLLYVNFLYLRREFIVRHFNFKHYPLIYINTINRDKCFPAMYILLYDTINAVFSTPYLLPRSVVKRLYFYMICCRWGNYRHAYIISENGRFFFRSCFKTYFIYQYHKQIYLYIKN